MYCKIPMLFSLSRFYKLSIDRYFVHKWSTWRSQHLFFSKVCRLLVMQLFWIWMRMTRSNIDDDAKKLNYFLFSYIHVHTIILIIIQRSERKRLMPVNIKKTLKSHKNKLFKRTGRLKEKGQRITNNVYEREERLCFLALLLRYIIL